MVDGVKHDDLIGLWLEEGLLLPFFQMLEELSNDTYGTLIRRFVGGVDTRQLCPR